MWLLLLLLFQDSSPCLPSPPKVVPTGVPSLIVQVVDPAWLPISGAQVTVKPLSGAGREESFRSDENGYCRFSLQEATEYSIQITATGFKKKRLKSLYTGKSSGPPATAYVQFKLDVGGPFETVY